ncbi:hypothetical protein GCM10028857_08820 [Salinarchaeum chitinilyticum]
MLTVPESVLERFRAFSLYNSPFRAHDDGRAIDLYPAARTPTDSTSNATDRGDDQREDVATSAPSPVAGEVVAIDRVRAPSKPYAAEHDYVLGIDTGATAAPTVRCDDGTPPIARILHVDPAVSVGDRVAVGDDLGEPIRAGFFAPWVGRHLHLGFRRPDDGLLRAAGSLRVETAVDVTSVAWDGTGTVVETGATYAVLDRPRHPDPGNCFAGIRANVAVTDGSSVLAPLDGGLPHYDRGGVAPDERARDGATVSLLGTPIGALTDGRTVEWHDPTVTANGTPIEGLSLAAAREALGAKLICPDLSLSVGDEVRVRIE